MGKIAAILWLPASIALTALAIANIIEYFHPGGISWITPFADALRLYAGFSKSMMGPVGDTVHQYADVNVPGWSGDAVMAYVASASGFAMGGSNFTSREGQFHALRSSAASMGWPLAIISFAFSAFKNHQVAKFAVQHTLLFVLYMIAVAAVLAGAVWGTALLPATS